MGSGSWGQCDGGERVRDSVGPIIAIRPWSRIRPAFIRDWFASKPPPTLGGRSSFCQVKSLKLLSRMLNRVP